MDKYTVDLDQVLNDFEYSELTEQQSRSVPDRTQHNVPFQAPPVTKHSINNVFHSLNEYLNSGINSGSPNVEEPLPVANPDKPGTSDNNLGSSNIQQTGQLEEHPSNVIDVATTGEAINAELIPVVNSKETEESASETTLTQNDTILNEEAVHLIEAHVIASEDAEENVCKLMEKPLGDLETAPLDSTVDSLEPPNVYSSKTENLDYSLLDVGEESVPDTVAMQQSMDCFSQDVPSCINDNFECDINVNGKADNSLDKDKSSTENNEIFAEVISLENDLDKAHINDQREDKNLHEKVEDLLINIDEDSFQSVNTDKLEENFVIEPSDSPYALGVPDVEVEPTKSVSPTIVAPSSNEGDCETTDENLVESTKEATAEEENTQGCDDGAKLVSDDADIEAKAAIEPDSPATKIASFSADLEIDENELNKMLEDLELEEQGEVEAVIEASKELPEECPGVLDRQETTEKSTNSDTVGEDSIVEVAPQALATEIKPIIEEEEEEEEIDKSGGGEVQEDTVTENVQPRVVECLEMECPKKSKDTKMQKQAGENVESQSESIGEVSAADQEQPPSRPQNLPLNNEVKEEHVGRKINLIGSPGSTPYNNVYINKAIEPKPINDIESDYTSSASPTFSDCSADSTSTASTVSIEDVPNGAPKVAQKPSKNTNSDRQEEPTSVDEAGEVDNLGPGAVKSEESVDQSTESAANVVDESSLNSSEAAASDLHVQASETFLDKSWLGKEAPLWIPDADAASCLHCDMKFTVIKRRHHCRACGLVLCSKCCGLKFRLEYLDSEARVCNKCYEILNRDAPNNAATDGNSAESSQSFRPNPNNPLEYCSTVSPLQQAGQSGAPPPSVMVPVGVLKRKGSNKKSNKSVMFCDGIAPGSDLTILDQDFNYNSTSKTAKAVEKASEERKKAEEAAPPPAAIHAPKFSRNVPKIDETTECFIPKEETSLPPTVSISKTDLSYSDCSNTQTVVETLKNQVLTFAINQNLFVRVQIINMNCCINKFAWCFCSEGLINVGCDEVVYLIEYIDEECFVPKDVFFHIQNVYLDAVKGTALNELGISLHNTFNFLGSRNHAGFVYIKPTFQCLENVLVPKEPYLIGILIHRWETPWAKLFPLRLILRLGADYRYYPSPLISTRHRDSVFVEIGHTIINLLADFRNFTYTLPQIRGLFIHMEEKKTTITIRKNRYDQVMKLISNSSEHILAFAGNFSAEADSHLVCIQDTQGPQNNYTTHAINIHNKPRKVTGASFIVFNGSLKTGSGLTAKSNIVEDGLMIQIRPESMEKIREDLRKLKNHTISCGPVNATSSDETETVNIVWGDNDFDFNVGVKSPVDLSDMQGVPSIRVHNGKDFLCSSGTRLIRWTEVFILQNGEETPHNQEPVDISKVSESVSKACCTALVKYLDLLVSNSCQKIGIRVTLHVENVSYSAGSNGVKLAPIYMRSLDNELVPVLHGITSNNLGDNAIVLELIFRILNA